MSDQEETNNEEQSTDYDEGLASEPRHRRTKLLIGWMSGFVGTAIFIVILFSSVTNGTVLASVAALCLALSVIVVGTDAGQGSI